MSEGGQDLAYHWSPSARRKGIERRGLVPGSMARSRQWRPPFVCLSRWHDEVRVYERIPARFLTYLATREYAP